MTVVTSSYEEVYVVLESIINTEFAPEGFTAQKDKLHDSVGHKGTRIAIYPEDDLVNPGNMLVQDSTVTLQFYNQYTLKVDPNQAVDPSVITNYAERFRRRLEFVNMPGTGSARVWFFDLTRIAYPDDPTGNKTRFIATIRAKGNNAGLSETTG